MNRIIILIFSIFFLVNQLHANENQANYIVIEGNKRISNEEVIEYSGFDVGKVYSQEDISVVIKNLFSTNLFTDIKVKLDQNTLYINVLETPIISRINVDGNELLETEQILSSLKSVGISQSKPYSKNLVDKVQQELVNVFVPTTPNPTSGFLLMFPKDEIIYLDMSFEEASKFIVSAGTSNPKN